MKELAEYLIKNIVDYPEKIKVTEFKGSQILLLELSVDKLDMGKIIGRDGRNISAIRTILHAIASRMDMRVELELVDSQDI